MRKKNQNTLQKNRGTKNEKNKEKQKKNRKKNWHNEQQPTAHLEKKEENESWHLIVSCERAQSIVACWTY